ncbi:hypothetical protein BDV96DRAFT_641727 [Lophiotrema nucula]|uniref:Uncharacterized protein n=1 Tax=Lophiotrema nucula TaxID=690887 RepID=A0A6A5ZJM7_9PLEO|nr:hypothetical protein BDV96DRAFT_641727 [Lophiotrema nucula]
MYIFFLQSQGAATFITFAGRITRFRLSPFDKEAQFPDMEKGKPCLGIMPPVHRADIRILVGKNFYQPYTLYDTNSTNSPICLHHQAHLQLDLVNNGLLLTLELLNILVGTEVLPTQPVPPLLDKPYQEGATQCDVIGRERRASGASMPMGGGIVFTIPGCTQCATMPSSAYACVSASARWLTASSEMLPVFCLQRNLSFALKVSNFELRAVTIPASSSLHDTKRSYGNPPADIIDTELQADCSTSYSITQNQPLGSFQASEVYLMLLLLPNRAELIRPLSPARYDRITSMHVLLLLPTPVTIKETKKSRKEKKKKPVQEESAQEEPVQEKPTQKEPTRDEPVHEQHVHEEPTTSDSGSDSLITEDGDTPGERLNVTGGLQDFLDDDKLKVVAHYVPKLLSPIVPVAADDATSPASEEKSPDEDLVEVSIDGADGLEAEFVTNDGD